ncbi:MAG: CoA transferase [Chloroflexi bacterium]|nr:CoA transferase [Chloroflexota bacterium]
MSKSERNKQALGDIRVLDLADARGQYCGKLLADLGADVIKVEPPGGDAARTIGPFFRDEAHVEKSLFWFRFNANKRSVTLDLDYPAGKALLKRLLSHADVVIETYPPGHLGERGIEYSALKEINPGLILTSITAFGQTGPWKDYKASDIVALALGGDLYPCGWPDLPPQYMAGLQAYHQVSTEAAAATLIALYHRLATGQGQHVDVSMQQSVPVCLQASTLVYESTGAIRKRIGNEMLQHSQALTPAAQGIFPCQDGFIDIAHLSGVAWWERLVDWLDAEGSAADLKEERWQDPFYRNTPEAVRHINGVLAAFLKTRTKEDIFVSGQKKGVVIGAVNTPEDVAKDPHLTTRSFFTPVEHAELGATLQYVGAPYRLSETPWRIARRPPLVGEHNSEVYEKELGMAKEQLMELKGKGVI